MDVITSTGEINMRLRRTNPHHKHSKQTQAHGAQFHPINHVPFGTEERQHDTGPDFKVHTVQDGRRESSLT